MSRRVESDDWRPGPDVLAQESLARLRKLLEQTPLIVECRFYRGSRSPERRIFEDYEELAAFLRSVLHPGDAVWIWRYDQSCSDENSALHGKVADSDGCVPSKGSY